MDHQRKPIDSADLHQARDAGQCFVCEMLAGNPDYRHHIVAETESAIAFLDKFPTMFGRVLVAPKRHLEQVTGDFSEAEYLELQSFVYHVSEAVRAALQPERVYILSLGSQAANAHVHWHIAPLPPGVPFKQQQFHALMHEHGSLTISDEEVNEYINKIRDNLN